MMDLDAIDRLRVEAKGAWSDYDRLHTEARTELNTLMRGLVAGAAEPSEVSRGSQRQQFLALHPRAFELVGAGVVEFGVAATEGTTDGDRCGISRLDFVTHHTDRS